MEVSYGVTSNWSKFCGTFCGLRVIVLLWSYKKQALTD